ncbi:uncharacterized protein PHALS_11191 [Plasmopara halstedii]|uniref:Uncharacterized protein n=1 Tax=Plasmopara halstedii TaxID=4781 RepID=A0A0P1AI92_PLAHL|nr:uncharacterized protein PHALS_11191 [Plasmopara halstedii]CEG41021.1 hypothetical protein PHALS_11191 [Plasmopara halstedii]|eukprot:XP_024577390.1 hypothetical protein PHALS_11191 [Plasmopara halstedii]
MGEASSIRQTPSLTSQEALARDSYPKLPNFWFGRLPTFEFSDPNRRELIYHDFMATGIDPGTKLIPHQLSIAEPHDTQAYNGQRVKAAYTMFTF